MQWDFYRRLNWVQTAECGPFWIWFSRNSVDLECFSFQYFSKNWFIFSHVIPDKYFQSSILSPLILKCLKLQYSSKMIIFTVRDLFRSIKYVYPIQWQQQLPSRNLGYTDSTWRGCLFSEMWCVTLHIIMGSMWCCWELQLNIRSCENRQRASMSRVTNLNIEWVVFLNFWTNTSSYIGI